MGPVTHEASLSWRSSESLWRRVVYLNPYSDVATEDGAGGEEQGEGRGEEQGEGQDEGTSPVGTPTQKPRLGPESAHYNLAVTLEKKGPKYAEAAIAQYRAAISINAQHPKSWSGLAMLHHSQGQAAEAVHAHQQAIAIQPLNPIYHYNLGNVLMENYKLQEAAECFQQSGSIDPTYWRAHNNLGNVLRVLGDLPGAERAYRACIAQNPSHSRALKNLGLMVREQARVEQEPRKLAEASGYFRRAVDADPRNQELGVLLQQTERALASSTRP